jgi:hypothetical protein
MKFRALKDFVSSIVLGVEGQEYDVELDEPTKGMWEEYGIIEEIKDVPAASQLLSKDPAPPQDAAVTSDETVASTD